jgi:hypothetical protein
MALAAVAATNAALNGLDGTGSTNTMPYQALHTASPSTTGANENANTGSYARQACSYNAASGGTKTNSTALTFNTLGTVPVTHTDGWSSVTYAAGSPSLGAALGASVQAGTITIAGGALSFTAA